MPKLRKDVEDKILALIEEGFTNIEVSEQTGVHRKTVANRRKAWENRKQDEEKPEEEIIRPEQPESTPFALQIYALMREQGTHSEEEAISQAILTQHSFNPYLSNHGLRTPTELITFFEDKIKEQDEWIELIQADADRYLNRLIRIQIK